MKLDTWVFFENLSRKFGFRYNLTRITGTLHDDLCTFLGAFAKVRKATISFVMSVRTHGTARLPLDRFLLHLIVEDFSKIYRENSSFIKIWQEKWVLYLKTYIYDHILLSSSQNEKFLDKMYRESQTHFMFSNFFFKYHTIYTIMLKNIVELDRSQMTIWWVGTVCWLPMATNSHSEYICNTYCFPQ
jgi:hypothetical protein